MSARQLFRRGQRVRLKHQRWMSSRRSSQVYKVRKFVRHEDCEGHYELYGTEIKPWQSQLVKVKAR